jgi:glycosyltransferase involved in cell wall biosynthesis
VRILKITHDYFPAIGGSELVFQRIAEGLVARGEDVWVFTSTARRTSDFIDPHAEGYPPGLESINGVKVRRFRYLRLPPLVRRAVNRSAIRWWSRGWPGYGHAKTAFVGPHLPGLVREAVRLRPDIIVATASPFRPIYLAARAARRAQVPAAIMPCLHPGDNWLLDNPALFSLLRSVDAVLTLTDYERLLLQSLGVPASRLRYLAGGVSAEAAEAPADTDLRRRFGFTADEPLVLFLGRKEEHKGVMDVAQAMIALWQAGSTARLVLAGASTPYSEQVLEPFLRELPPQWRSRVVSRTDISEAEKWGWYRECSLLAHPSRVESFGLIYLEAWLFGKPVIGCRSGPVSSLIHHGRDGLLVGYADRDELAAAIARLLDNPEAARAMGQEGRRKTLQNFTWAHVIDRAHAIYRALVEEHDASPAHQRYRRHLQ